MTKVFSFEREKQRRAEKRRQKIERDLDELRAGVDWLVWYLGLEHEYKRTTMSLQLLRCFSCRSDVW